MFKKKHKNINIYKQRNKKNGYVAQGLIGLKAISYGIVTKYQLESIRKVIVRKTKRNCKIWIKLSCTTPITKKSKGSRMGKGTGEVDSYIYNIKKGEIILEVLFNGLISEKTLVDILLIASNKLPIAIKINSKYINNK